jgi:hypothetical protein
MNQSTRTFSPRIRLALIACGVVLFLLTAGVLYVAFGVSPQTVDQPLEWTRGQDGDSAKGGPPSVHVAKLISKNNYSTSTVSSHWNPACFPTRSLLLFNRSDHLLMKRVGEKLLELLKKDSQLEHLEYFPVGHRPEPGIEAPDIVLSIDLESIEESGVVNRELEAQVKAVFGTSLAASNHSVNDSLAPPVVRFHARMTLDHHSTLTGFESSAAKYSQQGQNIAEQIAEGVLDKLTEEREKHQSQLDLTDGFRPPWREPPSFAFLDELEADQIISVHGLMVHNETFWKLPRITDVQQVFTTIRDELRSAGWKGGGKDDAPPTQPMRLTKGPKFLEVFDAVPATEKVAGPGESDTSTGLFVRYCDRMSSEGVSQAMEEMLAPGTTSIERLLELRRYANADQRKRILAMVEENPPETTDAWLTLADVFARRKDMDAVKDALRRAHHLTYAVTDTGDATRNIKEKAKKNKLNLEEITKTDPTLFVELGFKPLPPDGEPCHVGISAGQAAKFLLADEGEDWLALVVELGPPTGPEDSPTYAMTVLRSGPNEGRSWSRNSGRRMDHPYEERLMFHGREVTLRVEKQPDSTFHVTARFAEP